jgi:membrane-bound lytic murein transglycosylase D
VAWYLKHPAHLERTIERGRRYLYFIVGQLESRGMPTEIALLPIVESAYNPHAYSRMRAAGMWQFIPGTGRRYGLEQNVWYDGRRDVLAATKAALDYLQFLHDMFDDWELALAAYNWGEGAVQRAVAYNRLRHRSIAYSNLRMPNETRNYLPRLLAIRNLILKAKSFGLELQPIANRPYFTVVKSPGNIEVLRAAQLANMAVDEFRSLNPGYNRAVMLHGALHQIVLPVDNVDQFRANLASNSDPLVTWRLYRWKRGDNVQGVAARFGISVGRLREVNGFALKRRVSAGSIWLVPSVAKDNANDPEPTSDDPGRPDVSKKIEVGPEEG